MKNDIVKESNTRFESVEQLKSCLENDIPKLQEAIKLESTDREEAHANVNKKFTAILL